MSNSEYFPPYLTSSNLDSSEITVDLDLTDYAKKNRFKQCNSCRCKWFCFKN